MGLLEKGSLIFSKGLLFSIASPEWTISPSYWEIEMAFISWEGRNKERMENPPKNEM